MRTAPDQIVLPRIDEVPASVALTAVARQLEATYSDLVAESLPEPLAGLAERLSQEDCPDAEQAGRPDAESVKGTLERSSTTQSSWWESTLGGSKRG